MAHFCIDRSGADCCGNKNGFQLRKEEALKVI